MLGVVIPVYNRKDRLEKLLQNLEGQIYKRFIVVVVDDGSTEDIKSVCDKSPLKIFYVKQPYNQGPGAARQRGLEVCYKCNFELITFIDSDDLYAPHALERLTYEINHNNSDMVASGITWEKKNGVYSQVMPPGNTTWLAGKIFRLKSLYDNDISFDTTLRTNEDLAFNLKVRYSDLKLQYIEEILYIACDDRRSITRNKKQDSINCNGIDYIRAIYSAYKWLKEHNKPIEYNIYNIMQCYVYYEVWTERCGPAPDDIENCLHEMISDEEFAKILKSCYYWYRIKVNSFFVLDKQIYFFKETLYEFLKRYGYEREV